MTATAPVDEGWQRLDPRMLLVYPVRELVRFLPVVLGVLVAGSASGGSDWWHGLGVAFPVGLGVLRYVTTTFRVGTERVELRRGLLNRHLLSTPLDRVRSVDITASPVHRVLGLVTVRIGTGTASTDDDEEIHLDGLPAVDARRLRSELLRLGATSEPGTAPAEEPAVLHLDVGWARYAPLTSSGLAIAAGVVGAASQAINVVGGWDRLDPEQAVSDAAGWSLAVALPLVVIALLVVVSALSVGGYLLTNWGFTLMHSGSAGRGAWHVRRGLLTTRETSLDDERVRGATVGEPLGLRLAGAARASAIATGLRGDSSASALLAPPAPRDVVVEAAGRVLGGAGPLTTALVDHGPRARRRRWTRALVPTSLVAAAVAGLVATSALPPWTLVVAFVVLVAGALVARDRARALGHALVDGHLVAQAGSLDRRREALHVPAIIGWTLRASWFQRRAGLVSLVATTAGGSQSVTLLDVPETTGTALAHAALPELLAPFLVDRASVSPETEATAAARASL